MVSAMRGNMLDGIGHARAGEDQQFIRSHDFGAAQGFLQVFHAAVPACLIGLDRAAGPGEFQQAGIDYRDFQVLVGQVSGIGLHVGFPSPGIFAIAARLIAHFHEEHALLVRETGGVVCVRADFVGDGADARTVPVGPCPQSAGARRGSREKFPSGHKTIVIEVWNG
jgi:hypothetical protein